VRRRWSVSAGLSLLGCCCFVTPSLPTARAARPFTSGHQSELKGFGATTAAWNSAHKAVPGYIPGAVYDTDPSLPKVNGHEGSKYFAVIHENGRVLQYEMAFANLPVSDVQRQILLTEFPPDARTLWFVVKDSCAQMLVQSATVGKALSGKAIGDTVGTTLIEFSSGAADVSYNSKRVNDALFILAGYTARSQAPAC
jgi:hypothetical protein